MVTSEIVSYIKAEKAKQVPDESIRSSLLSAGWSTTDIDAAFGNTNQKVPLPPPAPFKPTTVQVGSMWDAFQHVLMFISLYVFASSVALILHYFVDKYLPGIDLNSYGSISTMIGSAALYGYLSALIVSFPLWAFFFLKINLQTGKLPQIRQLSARRMLIYLTLIGTFITMMANVISTVFSFLSGNISLNFGLHFIITTSIAAIIFKYYLDEVKEDRRYV